MRDFGAKPESKSHPSAGRAQVSLGEPCQCRWQRSLCGSSVAFPPSAPSLAFFPAHSPVPRAARSPQGLPIPSARTEKQQCLRVYRFCTSRRRRAEGGQAVLNLPGIGVAAGRRERRGCVSAPTPNTAPDHGERLSRPWQKGLLPGDCQLGTVLAWKLLCVSACCCGGCVPLTGPAWSDMGLRTSSAVLESPQVRDQKGAGDALNCPPVNPHLTPWKTCFWALTSAPKFCLNSHTFPTQFPLAKTLSIILFSWAPFLKSPSNSLKALIGVSGAFGNR